MERRGVMMGVEGEVRGWVERGCIKNVCERGDLKGSVGKAYNDRAY